MLLGSFFKASWKGAQSKKLLHLSHNFHRLYFSTNNTPGLGLFKKMGLPVQGHSLGSIVNFICDRNKLKKFLIEAGGEGKNNYLNETFSTWLSCYSSDSRLDLHRYFSGEMDLNSLSKNFARYCFSRDIELDAGDILDSLSHHNKLSDNVIKQNVERIISSKETINIMGYGLDDGSYEKSIAAYLIDKNIASQVNIYGFDPYAHKGMGIRYLSADQLANSDVPSFDLVIARWVLHHVELQDRWSDFIKCVNKSGNDAVVLVLEHGFVDQDFPIENKRLYYLLNATLDVVVNIAIRPDYFTCTAPDIGANFFIKYLEQNDFQEIESHILSKNVVIDCFDAGPEFPNQSLIRMIV